MQTMAQAEMELPRALDWILSLTPIFCPCDLISLSILLCQSVVASIGGLFQEDAVSRDHESKAVCFFCPPRGCQVPKEEITSPPWRAPEQKHFSQLPSHPSVTKYSFPALDALLNPPLPNGPLLSRAGPLPGL